MVSSVLENFTSEHTKNKNAVQNTLSRATVMSSVQPVCFIQYFCAEVNLILSSMINSRRTKNFSCRKNKRSLKTWTTCDKVESTMSRTCGN